MKLKRIDFKIEDYVLFFNSKLSSRQVESMDDLNKLIRTTKTRGSLGQGPILDDRPLAARVRRLPDGGRMLTYFDITELKRAEQVSRDSEARLRRCAAAWCATRRRCCSQRRWAPSSRWRRAGTGTGEFPLLRRRG